MFVCIYLLITCSTTLLRNNFNDPREVLINVPQTIEESGIVLADDTVIIVHGHQASAFDSLNPTMKNGK